MKKETEQLIDLIRLSFDFLTTKCDYFKQEELCMRNISSLKSNYVITYVSFKAQKQIETAINIEGSVFSVIIRRLIDGKPAPYKSRTDSLLATELLFLLNGDYEDEQKNYSHNYVGIEKTIKNFGKLLQYFQVELCNEKWLDGEKIKKHHIDYYKRKRGYDLTSSYENKETIYDIIKGKLSFLTEQGYNLILDTDELPIYEYSRWLVIYNNGTDLITINGPTYDDQSYGITINKTRLQSLVFDKSYKSQDDFTNYLVYIIKEALQ